MMTETLKVSSETEQVENTEHDQVFTEYIVLRTVKDGIFISGSSEQMQELLTGSYKPFPVRESAPQEQTMCVDDIGYAKTLLLRHGYNYSYDTKILNSFYLNDSFENWSRETAKPPTPPNRECIVLQTFLRETRVYGTIKQLAVFSNLKPETDFGYRWGNYINVPQGLVRTKFSKCGYKFAYTSNIPVNASGSSSVLGNGELVENWFKEV